MMNNNDRNEMKMGDGIRSYRPGVVNPNVIVNTLLGPASRAAFPDLEGAIIIQQKKIPDVSFWQGEIDWDLMRSKTDSIIIRGGQNVWPDAQFERNWSEAKKRGMKRGIYWFYDDRVSPGAQAEKLNSLVEFDRPEMEVIVDWERVFGGSFRGLPNVVSMMERIEDFEYQAALYTGYFFFRGSSNAVANASQYAYLKTRPLHLAWYTDNASDVLIPFPWLELWMWQFGTPAEGPAHGAHSEEIDMNFVNMTNDQFYARYGSEDPIPQPEPEEPMPETRFRKITQPIVNMRSATVVATTTDLGNTDDTNLKLNDIIQVDEAAPISGGYTWRRVLRWWRNNVEKTLPTSSTGQVWVAEKAGSTGFYMVPVDFTPPTSPNPEKSPFTLNVQGFKSFTGELEKDV